MSDDQTELDKIIANHDTGSNKEVESNEKQLQIENEKQEESEENAQGDVKNDEAEEEGAKPKEEVKEADEVEQYRVKVQRQRAALAQTNREIRELKKQLEQFKAEQLKAKEELIQAKEPAIEDFDDIDDFIKAKVDWNLNKKTLDAEVNKNEESQNKKEQELKVKQAEIEAKRVEDMKTQELKYLQENPDYLDQRQEFQQYVESIQASPDVEDALIDLILKKEAFPQIVTYFTKNHGANMEALVDIMQKDVVDSVLEMNKIIMKIKSGDGEAPKMKPPEPHSKTKGKSVTKSLENMSGTELKAFMKN